MWKCTKLFRAQYKLLWKLFKEGRTDRAGVFLNMDTMKMNPLIL